MSNIRDKENEGKINNTGEKENKGKINNKSKLLDVFKFSFVQNVKNKTFIILTLVCALMMMIIMPITAYIGSSQSEKRKSSIKRVEIIDDNGFMVNALNLSNKGTKIEAFGNVKFIAIDKDVEEYKKEFNKDKTKLDEKEIEFIKHVVKTHMGKWNTNPYSDVVLEVPKDRYQYFVHMCDYLASRKFINVKFEGEEIE